MSELPWRPPADAWSRRDLLRNGFASAALLCTVASPASLRRRGPVTSAALRAQGRSPFEPFRRDLPRIPELLPVRRTRTTDFYESTIQEGMADVLPGFQTPIYGYEGVYPGPTIRARTGRRVVIRQRNALTFDSNVHLHGGYVTAGQDGHPMDVIAAGRTFEYHYPNHQDAATLWYHDHAHGRTSRTLYYGLLAFYVLEDDLERELELPTGDYDVPIVIADHAFNKDGSFRYAESIDVGFRGDTVVVNGAISPRMRVERRKYRLRFLNASNARSYTLRLGKGHAMTQIAGDGGLLERPVRRAQHPAAPGRARRPRDRLPRLPARDRARAPQHRRPGRHRRGHALRRRPRRRRGGPRAAPPQAARSAAAGDDEPALGPRAGHELVADQRADLRSRADRRAPAAGDERALDVREPLQPRAPDAPARLPVPRAVSAAAAACIRPTGSAGRTRSASCPTRP